MKTYKLFTYLFILLLATAQASQQDFNNNEPENKYKQFEEGMAKHLPKFVNHKNKELKKLQEGEREAVLVIGQTGAGKSTLIGGLLGHKFILENEKCSDDESSDDDYEKVLVNTNSHGPKISHSITASRTSFPKSFLDSKTNLAFIDTAGLEDTRKNGEAINLCNSMVLSKIIENIGSLKCIIGVISYNSFEAGRGSKAFLNLFTVFDNLIKNKSLYATCTSSILLAFTKVPEHIKEENITKKLKKRCKHYREMRKNNKMSEEDKKAEVILKVLFPSFDSTNFFGININNKKDVPFFLIRQRDLLNHGLVRNNMLPTLQKAEKIGKKDIGFVLTPSLLQKTQRWLRNRAESVANDIRSKEYTEKKITDTKDKRSFIQKQLSDKKALLQYLTSSDSKNETLKKENTIKDLEKAIQYNIQRIEELSRKIEDIRSTIFKKKKEREKINTTEVKSYKTISYCSEKEWTYFYFSYNDVPIHHIIYNGKNNNKDPKRDDDLGDYISVESITKNYQDGKLEITAKNNHWFCYYTPENFGIHAQKKHIYRNKINTLTKDIGNLEECKFDFKNQQKNLPKEIQIKENQCKKLRQDLLKQEALIKQTKNEINTKSQEVSNIQLQLPSLENQLNLWDEKIRSHQDKKIFYIITNVASCIGFHNNQQHNIDACKRYMKRVQKNNYNNNNKDIENSLGYNTKFMDNEEERKQDDNNYNNNQNNWRSSSSVIASVATGTIGIISRLKKRN